MSILDVYPQLNCLRDRATQKKISLFLVGGLLRDWHLGKRGTDFDFAVSKDAIAFARGFARQVKGAFVLLDDAHGSARVVRSEDGVIWTYDFTDFRGKSIAKDLARRDFTVNTFCICLNDLKEYTPKNALSDLKKKCIRMVSAKSFKDDPLRLLRAYSLLAQTGFKIEAKTKACIKRDAHLINRAAMERIREEVFKVLQSPRAFVNLVSLNQSGLLERIMPQIAVMFGVHQGGYHHLDVWKHSLEVVHQLEEVMLEHHSDERLNFYLNEPIGGAHSRGALLKLAALLHDIGKPETRKKEVDRMTFHSHEHVGSGITRHVAKRLKVSVKERYFLEDAVRLHLRPGYLSNFKRPSQRVVFRYMRDTKEEAVSIALLAMADQRATQGPLTTRPKNEHHAKICRMIIDEYFKEKAKPVRVKLLTGHDLIKILKLKPSPFFAKILNAVDEAQAVGKISTKPEALSLAKASLFGFLKNTVVIKKDIVSANLWR